MKDVLFVTYFWPPSGKATIHWPLGVVRRLGEHGWRASVLTVENEGFERKDESLLARVPENVETVRARAWEPFDLYRKALGKPKGEPLVASETVSKENAGFMKRLTMEIRMQLFVPDARAGWYPRAVKAGAKFMERKKFDAIVTIGPPHTAHLVGRKLAKRAGIPFFPVFVDPWTDIVYYRDFWRNPLTRAVDRRFEKKTVEDAAGVVFVTDTTRRDFAERYPNEREKYRTLYWGFDGEAFPEFDEKPTREKKRLLHAGNIFDYQNPAAFWRRLARERDEGRLGEIRFVGTVSPGVRRAVGEAGLSPIAKYLGFLPYREAAREMIEADWLLACVTEPRHVPGKLFEYLRAEGKIVAFGDENEEAAAIIRDANAGVLAPYASDGEEFFRRLDEFKTDREFVAKFDRREIARGVARLLEKKS
jgi:hypothetical protein